MPIITESGEGVKLSTILFVEKGIDNDENCDCGRGGAHGAGVN